MQVSANLNYRENNFDLIRLFAAMQVMFLHSFYWFQLDETNSFIRRIADVIWYFPGVTIFFSMSGFLITKSLFKDDRLKHFFRNRFLRIYPALWLCFLFTLVILFSFGIIHSNDIFSFSFLKYTIAQLTFFQYYVPAEFKTFGAGHPNGALWTISVELQFYVLIFLLYRLVKNKNIRTQNIFILSLSVLSMIVNWKMNNIPEESMTRKLLFVSVFPFFYYFVPGILIFINYNKLIKLLQNKALIWSFVYAAVLFFCSLSDIHFYRYEFDLPSLLIFCALILFCFSWAFSFKGLSNKILKHNDISYGIYLYHCVILNTILQLGFSFGLYWVGIAAVITLALLSWFLLERRILSLK